MLGTPTLDSSKPSEQLTLHDLPIASDEPWVHPAEESSPTKKPFTPVPKLTGNVQGAATKTVSGYHVRRYTWKG